MEREAKESVVSLCKLKHLKCCLPENRYLYHGLTIASSRRRVFASNQDTVGPVSLAGLDSYGSVDQEAHMARLFHILTDPLVDVHLVDALCDVAVDLLVSVQKAGGSCPVCPAPENV